jgi:hypothetical protein
MHSSGDRRRGNAEVCLPSLRGANGSRERATDDKLREEAIQLLFRFGEGGLLRFARNDG